VTSDCYFSLVKVPMTHGPFSCCFSFLTKAFLLFSELNDFCGVKMIVYFFFISLFAHGNLDK
jgi:hypothetical protein